MAELLVAAAAFGRVGSNAPEDVFEEDPYEQQQQTKAIKLKRAPGKTTDVYSWFEITLQSIDVPSQTFTASIEVHLFWQDYNLPNLVPNYKTSDFVIHDDYVPVKMSEIFENKKDIANTEPQFTYYDKTGTIYMMFIVQCTFSERMELQRFPFDRQFMNMEFNAHINPVMEEEGPWNWILQYPEWMPQELNKFNQKFAVRMLSSITEYELLEPWVDYSSDTPPLAIRLRVNRLPSYYFGNIVFPNFLIVAGCFSAFVIPRDEIADRLSVTVTLMLAAVAFRFIVSLMLPKVSYLTIMDYYLLLGFLALISLIAENAVAGIPGLEQYGAAIDLYSAIVFAGIWIIVHVIAVIALVSKEFLRIGWQTMDIIDRTVDEEQEFIYAEKKHVRGNTETELGRSDWAKYKKYDVLDRADVYAKTHNIRRTNTFQNKLRRRKLSGDVLGNGNGDVLGKIYEDTINAEDRKHNDSRSDSNYKSGEAIEIYVPPKLPKVKKDQRNQISNQMVQSIQLSEQKRDGNEDVEMEEKVEVEEVQSETAEVIYAETASPHSIEPQVATEDPDDITNKADYVSVDKVVVSDEEIMGDEEQLINTGVGNVYTETVVDSKQGDDEDDDQDENVKGVDDYVEVNTDGLSD